MKNKTLKELKEKFKNNVLVKPLYKKVGKRVGRNVVTINFDNNCNLEGDGPNVKKVRNNFIKKVILVDDENDDNLPGACEFNKHEIKVKTKSFNLKDIKMLENNESEIVRESFISSDKMDKLIQAQRSVVIQNVTDLWLRVYPLPRTPMESVSSVIFRCIACQLGLATLLILWTLIWVFLIYAVEGPYELRISEEFEREQNQLVIDLATELRQITPLSPKWRDAIEKRIQEERQITIQAVGEGARINPGQFWDLGGTFLFSIYVMTALGFGAPVPHTMWGRNAALIYAFIAVPTHIYLMVNMSICLIVKLEICCYHKKNHQVVIKRKGEIKTNNESPSCRRNSELMKSTNHSKLRKKLVRVLRVPCACRCVPLAALAYYACGAVAFGVLRERKPLEVFMFPLEFTTTGGLEHVSSLVRVLYGLYVEGAMVLLSCALATLRRYSTANVNSLAEKYRLFHVQRS